MGQTPALRWFPALGLRCRPRPRSEGRAVCRCEPGREGPWRGELGARGPSGAAPVLCVPIRTGTRATLANGRWVLGATAVSVPGERSGQIRDAVPQCPPCAWCPGRLRAGGRCDSCRGAAGRGWRWQERKEGLDLSWRKRQIPRNRGRHSQQVPAGSKVVLRAPLLLLHEGGEGVSSLCRWESLRPGPPRPQEAGGGLCSPLVALPSGCCRGRCPLSSVDPEPPAQRTLPDPGPAGPRGGLLVSMATACLRTRLQRLREAGN